MSKWSSNDSSPLTKKAVVVKILQSKSTGDVFKVKDHIRKQHHIDNINVFCDTQRNEVCVLGCERALIDDVM